MYLRSTIKPLLFCAMFISSVSKAEEKKSPEFPSVSMSPTYNNTPVIAPNISPEISPTFINNVYSLSYAVGMQIRDITVIWMEEVKKKIPIDSYDQLKSLMKTMLWTHRYTVVGTTAVGSYSVINILLLTDYHYINQNNAWSRWKSECTFEDLYAIPQKELARELLLRIGQEYYNEKNPTDLAHPLITFIDTIDIEIKTLKRYIKTAHIIKKLHLIKIFPTNESKINRAEQSLQRVLFIKHIFLSWLSEYNLVSNYKH